MQPTILSCTRRLTFCAGHRVFGHENKCSNLHGHNYVAEITAKLDQNASLDSCGRIIDFSCIKEKVGGWIDDNWDHSFIYYEMDRQLYDLFHNPAFQGLKVYQMHENPTAENMAELLLKKASTLIDVPRILIVSQVKLWETENCYACAEIAEPSTFTS